MTSTGHVTGAAIQTATVQLQVITVNDKQMTLAVFRQLPNGNPWVDWARLWGTVNYHPKCNVFRPHLHVVFEQDGKLWKSTEEQPSRGDYGGVVWNAAANRNATREEVDRWFAEDVARYESLATLPQLYIAV